MTHQVALHALHQLAQLPRMALRQLSGSPGQRRHSYVHQLVGVALPGVTTGVDCDGRRSDGGKGTGAEFGCDACVTAGVGCAKALQPVTCTTSPKCLLHRLVDSIFLRLPPMPPLTFSSPPTCCSASPCRAASRLLNTTHLLVLQPPPAPHHPPHHPSHAINRPSTAPHHPPACAAASLAASTSPVSSAITPEGCSTFTDVRQPKKRSSKRALQQAHRGWRKRNTAVTGFTHQRQVAC